MTSLSTLSRHKSVRSISIGSVLWKLDDSTATFLLVDHHLELEILSLGTEDDLDLHPKSVHGFAQAAVEGHLRSGSKVAVSGYVDSNFANSVDFWVFCERLSDFD